HGGQGDEHARRRGPAAQAPRPGDVRLAGGARAAAHAAARDPLGGDHAPPPRGGPGAGHQHRPAHRAPQGALANAPLGVELDAVTHRFGSTEALTDVSLSIRPGVVTGLVGRNGAGKTTLLSLVAAL